MDLSILANFVTWPGQSWRKWTALAFRHDWPLIANAALSPLIAQSCRSPLTMAAARSSGLRMSGSGNSVASARHVRIRHRSPYPSILSWR
jgi:hypothetical protein